MCILVEKPLLIFSNTKISINYQKSCTTKPLFINYLICCILSWYAANMQQFFLMMFFRVPTSNLSFLQSFMQIYSKLPDLGSMLQLGYCAAYMQQYAATWTFFGKKTFLIFPNTKILLHYKRLYTTKPPFIN